MWAQFSRHRCNSPSEQPFVWIFRMSADEDKTVMALSWTWYWSLLSQLEWQPTYFEGSWFYARLLWGYFSYFLKRRHCYLPFPLFSFLSENLTPLRCTHSEENFWPESTEVTPTYDFRPECYCRLYKHFHRNLMAESLHLKMKIQFCWSATKAIRKSWLKHHTRYKSDAAFMIIDFSTNKLFSSRARCRIVLWPLEECVVLAFQRINTSETYTSTLKAQWSIYPLLSTSFW